MSKFLLFLADTPRLAAGISIFIRALQHSNIPLGINKILGFCYPTFCL